MISDVIIFWMEWIGTISFACSGALVAIGCGLDIFGVATVGCITAMGGGILRDVLVNEKPYVLVRHIYAVVSIMGCSFYYLFSVTLEHKVFATFFVLIFTVVMRLLAARYRWKLPKIRLDEEER